MKITNAKTLAVAINEKLKAAKTQILVFRDLKASTGIDLDHDDGGFILYLTHGEEKQTAQDFTVVFSADVSERSLNGGGSIVEIKNLSIEGIESDSYEWGTENIDFEGAEELIETANEIVRDANFYRIVSDDNHTTDDLEATYEELCKNYSNYGY